MTTNVNPRQPVPGADTLAHDVRPDASRPPWRALPIILVPVFMVTLDVFIVNVAIPSIQARLHASPAAIQSVISGFALAIAGLLLRPMSCR